MAEPKTKPNDGDVVSFLMGVDSEQRRQDCFTILGLMKEITGAEPKMWGTSIIGFGTMRMKYADGHEADWPPVGFSPRKQNLTLYLMGGLVQHEDLLRQLGKHTIGKSCLYIKRLSDVDLSVLRTLIEQSAALSTKDGAQG